MVRLLFCGFCILTGVLMAGCEFFESPQERSGMNPKPFNSQTTWETTPYTFRN